MNGGNQPIFVLPEGTFRNTGKDAQKNNISAAKAVGDTVRTTLGPKGMDKMLVDSIGDIVITNDGVTILDEMEIEHPAAKMMVEVAKTQEESVGDGTTTAVIFASELLKKAEELLDQNIHPTIITKGFRIARKEVLDILNKIAVEIHPEKDKDVLKNIAMTAMTGKSAEKASEHLADLAVEAVRLVEEDGEINSDDIKLEKKQGGGIEDTELIRGLVIDKEIVHGAMAKKIQEANIALVDSALEVKEMEADAKINITSPEQLESFLEKEENMIKEMVNNVEKSDANILFCQKGIDDSAQHLLAKKGITAIRRVKKSDMEALARATGAKIISNLEDLEKNSLGYAKLVEEKRIGGEKMVFVRDCKTPKAVSILIRGGTEHVVDETERAMKDCIGGVIATLENKRAVAGGGAIEEEVCRKLKKISQSYSGREQLAIIAFAEALEAIPRTLAENAGLDPIDMLVNIRAAHDEGKELFGLDVINGKVVDMWKKGVIEPLKIKTQAINSGSEAAEMILRIDDVVNAGKLDKGMGGGSGGPPMPPGGGMGGMPPMM